MASPSQIWTLKSATGTEQTLAAWGIARAVVERMSQAPDVLKISVGNAQFDDAELFAFDGIVTLKRSGVNWFVGRCTRTPRTGRPSSEGMDYEFQGPWFDLEQVVFQQTWTMFDGSSQVTAPQSRVNLFSSITGALITTSDQINAALGWATGAGAALTAGTLPTGIYVPTEQGTDLTCAEVIKRALRWMPDVVTWFDYTTTPPTLKMDQRTNLTALSLAVAGAPAEEIDIVARKDLQPPVVVIKYSQTNIVNGAQALSLLTEQYPVGPSPTQRRALVLSVNLAGSNQSFLSQDIVAPVIDATDIAWWKLHLPELNDESISSLAYVGGTQSKVAVNDGETVHPNELTDGAIADWMNKSTTEAFVSAQLSFDQSTTDGAGNTVTHKIVGRTFKVKVVTTDAATDTYQSTGTSTLADPKPESLAQNYYTALATLQYEGSFAVVEQEVGDLAAASGGPWANRVLNLTGGLDEWATMKAQIYAVTEDLNTGRTLLRFGPHKNLSPADLVAQLRATRTRVIPELTERSGGVTSGGSQTLPNRHKEQTPGKGESSPDLVIVHNTDKTLTIQLTGVSSGDLPNQNLTLKPRLLSVCLGGEVKSMLAFISETIT